MNSTELVEKPIASQHEQEEHWTEIIEPRNRLFDLRLKEVWRYRDLVAMFIRRDFVATYKQTILGPIWFFVQQCCGPHFKYSANARDRGAASGAYL